MTETKAVTKTSSTLHTQGTKILHKNLNPGQDTRARNNTNPAQSPNGPTTHSTPPRTRQRLTRELTSCSSTDGEALVHVSRHDALLRQLHRPLRPGLRLLRALALQVALAPDLVELQARCAVLLRYVIDIKIT